MIHVNRGRRRRAGRRQAGGGRAAGGPFPKFSDFSGTVVHIHRQCTCLSGLRWHKSSHERPLLLVRESPQQQAT